MWPVLAIVRLPPRSRRRAGWRQPARSGGRRGRPPSAGEVVVEPCQRAGPGVLGRLRLVAVALVAVEAVPGLGVADDLRLLAGRRRRRPQLLDAVDRDALVEVAVEAEPGGPQPGGLLDQRPEAEPPFGDAPAVEGDGGAEVSPGGGHQRHRPAHAEADDAGLREGAPGAGEVAEGGVDVGHHAFGGQLLHVGRDRREVAVAELGVAAAVEEVRGDGQPSLGGEVPGDVLDVVVDAERLLDHDDAALGRPVRPVDRERSLLSHASDSSSGRKSTSSTEAPPEGCQYLVTFAANPVKNTDMKRATIAAVAAVASLVVAGCHSGSPSRPQASGGAVNAETSTSSSTTTTASNMTGTTRVPAARVSQAMVAADCPGAVALEGTAGSATRNSLQMVSAQKGFAVDATTVLVTDDGRTWTVRHNGSEPMFSVDAVDADHAWAVGQNVVLATADGGRTWRPVAEPGQGMLRIVDFIDAGNGWGATAGHLYRTTDGGQTWTRADAPCGGEAVCFTGPDDGWAAEGPHVYRSTDGGDTWQPAFTVPSDGIDLPFNPQSIHVSQLQCARPGVAWVYFTAAASGSHVGYAAYRGTAAGQWTPVMKEPEA